MIRPGGRRIHGLWLVPALLLLHSPIAQAQAEVTDDDELADNNADETADEDGESFSFAPSENKNSGASPLTIRGYVDVGFVNAQGDGTSFAPGDTRFPADYGVDTFATAVNSRGDVASTRSEVDTNGFLPTSVDVGGKPSFLLNTADVDLLYAAPGSPITVFVRMQLLPRFTESQNRTLILVEQAFGRIQPFASQEMTVTVGKFDSVFGIEYLENQANFRTGITPSLMARYTTGTSVGAKAFYRLQIAPLWSALSVNIAATNSGNMVYSLQGPDKSLTGMPVGSARVGYELNTPFVGIKLGGSGLYGPRNDQTDPDADQRMLGADARITLFGLSLNGEYVHVDEGTGSADGKITGLGEYALASAFHARGYYAQAAYGIAVPWGALRKLTLYGRYDWRHAWFEGFIPITVERITGGLRIDLWATVALKGEYLLNREIEGAPEVDNDVLTTSLVFSW